MAKTITLNELAEAAKLDRRTLRNYVARGMPCVQIGRKATEPGTTSTPYLFDLAGCRKWIDDFRTTTEELRASPYMDRLSPEDVRYDAAVTDTRKIEADIQDILASHVSRQHIAQVTHLQFEALRSRLLKLPAKFAPSIATATGKNREKIHSMLLDELTAASGRLRVENIFTDAPLLRDEILGEVEPEPESEDDDLDIPTARRYAPSDPRFALVKARTARKQLEIAIEHGVLLSVDLVSATLGTIYGEVHSMLRAVGGSVAQRLGSDAATSRTIKDEIDSAIFKTYDAIPNDTSDLDFEDEPEMEDAL